MRSTWPSSHQRGRRWRLVSVLAVILAVVGVAVVVRQRPDAGPELCAGVAWRGAPVASSSSEAFAAWLAENPNEPPIEDWERGESFQRRVSKRRVASYRTTRSRRYWKVALGTGGVDARGRRLGTDDWQVDGACVGTSPTFGG